MWGLIIALSLSQLASAINNMHISSKCQQCQMVIFTKSPLYFCSLSLSLSLMTVETTATVTVWHVYRTVMLGFHLYTISSAVNGFIYAIYHILGRLLPSLRWTKMRRMNLLLSCCRTMMMIVKIYSRGPVHVDLLADVRWSAARTALFLSPQPPGLVGVVTPRTNSPPPPVTSALLIGIRLLLTMPRSRSGWSMWRRSNHTACFIT